MNKHAVLSCPRGRLLSFVLELELNYFNVHVQQVNTVES